MTGLRESADTEEPPRELHESNLSILRGEITVNEAIERGLLSFQQIREWQAHYLVSRAEEKPWEKILSTTWRLATRGWLKYITVPLFLLFIVLPASESLYESGTKLWHYVVAALSSDTSEMEASERDVCNEWVARVGRFDTKDDARKAKEDLLAIMKSDNEWSWVDDIHVARDIETANHYLLLVDMFQGPSDAVRE